ncbi:MAG: carbohydrate ABC transporter permease [Defluviitaleaceae bacterium]|nr:carbohydrate ABC transporter permease [Defluviitaleaceae bacterium]
MVKYKSPGDVVFRIINTTIMAIILVLAIYPVVWLVLASVSNPLELHTAPTRLLLWPRGFSTAAYGMVMTNSQLWRAYGNTIFYAISGTFISVTVSMLGGYVLSRKYLPGRRFFTLLIVFTMFFGGGLIPFFIVVDALGLFDTRWAMILPNAISVFYVIMIISFCRGIPDEMEESAKIDGANDFYIFYKVMMPLAKPIIAVMVLFYTVDIWNTWMWGQIFLRSRSLLPLQVILREILVLTNPDMMNLGAHGVTAAAEQAAFMDAVQYAVIVVSMIPIVALYPVIQKYFISGVMVGALKG